MLRAVPKAPTLQPSLAPILEAMLADALLRLPPVHSHPCCSEHGPCWAVWCVAVHMVFWPLHGKRAASLGSCDISTGHGTPFFKS